VRHRGEAPAQQSRGIFSTQLTQERLPDYGRLSGIQNKRSAYVLYFY